MLVITTGIIGAVGARYPLFDAMDIRDPAVLRHRHRLPPLSGTARALQVSEQAGAFAALAMGLNGLLTALALPLLLPWLTAWLGG